MVEYGINLMKCVGWLLWMASDLVHHHEIWSNSLSSSCHFPCPSFVPILISGFQKQWTLIQFEIQSGLLISEWAHWELARKTKVSGRDDLGRRSSDSLCRVPPKGTCLCCGIKFQDTPRLRLSWHAHLQEPRHGRTHRSLQAKQTPQGKFKMMQKV